MSHLYLSHPCQRCDASGMVVHAADGELVHCSDCKGQGEFLEDFTPNIGAAVKAQTDKLMEGYVIFRNPEQGGSELKRYEVVEMLEWSMSDAVAAALTPPGDDS